MYTSVYILIGSFIAIVVLILIFKIENKYNFRLFSWLRSKLDSLVVIVTNFLRLVRNIITTGKLRVISHYLIHKVLNIVINFLKKIEGYFVYLQLRNKKIVKEVQKVKNNNSLSAVIDHKDSVALTDTQKQKMKEKSLQG